MIPNPSTLINASQDPLPEVEQMGVMTLAQLHEYHCENPNRRMVALYGVVYDVTSSVQSYGAEGAYKEYAGHGTWGSSFE
jgi:hypothetical protein